MSMIAKVVLALSLAAGGATPALAAEPIAVIVNRDNPKAALTADELRSMYLGKRTEWPDGGAVLAIDQAPSAPGRGQFLDAVVGMTPQRFAEHWVDQQVRGAGSAPKAAASPAAAVKLVARYRGAVAFVPLSQVTSAVKVVLLNGKLPGQRGYPIN